MLWYVIHTGDFGTSRWIGHQTSEKIFIIVMHFIILFFRFDFTPSTDIYSCDIEQVVNYLNLLFVI